MVCFPCPSQEVQVRCALNFFFASTMITVTGE
jgi:hypothetical protein